MSEREQIAAELMRGCPDESRSDHEAIAAALRRGETDGYILNMPETNRWPETYSWLATALGVHR